MHAEKCSGKLIGTTLSIRRGTAVAAIISALALDVGFAAPARAQQQAPEAATNLGVMVVTPSASTASSTMSRHVRIKRLSLKLNPQLGGIASTATPKPSAVPAHPSLSIRTPPHALHLVSPRYPQDALDQSLRGSVTVGFIVERDGSTADIHIVSSTPPGVFDEAARQAVRQWRFQPATANGAPVPTRASETLVFNPPLQKQAAPTPPPRP
ncbi:MAG: energy transducer TonB, partial [Gammaproteobacteria bacterium]